VPSSSSAGEPLYGEGRPRGIPPPPPRPPPNVGTTLDTLLDQHGDDVKYAQAQLSQTQDASMESTLPTRAVSRPAAPSDLTAPSHNDADNPEQVNEHMIAIAQVDTHDTEGVPRGSSYYDSAGYPRNKVYSEYHPKHANAGTSAPTPVLGAHPTPHGPSMQTGDAVPSFPTPKTEMLPSFPTPGVQSSYRGEAGSYRDLIGGSRNDHQSAMRGIGSYFGANDNTGFKQARRALYGDVRQRV
jgi:hypothetical protein